MHANMLNTIFLRLRHHLFEVSNMRMHIAITKDTHKMQRLFRTSDACDDIFPGLRFVSTAIHRLFDCRTTL